MVAADTDVLAWMPFRAALAEDDVARDDVLGCRAFEAEAAAGGVFGAVGAALGLMGGVAVLGCGEAEGGEGGGEGGEGWGGWGEGVRYSWLEHREASWLEVGQGREGRSTLRMSRS